MSRRNGFYLVKPTDSMVSEFEDEIDENGLTILFSYENEWLEPGKDAGYQDWCFEHISEQPIIISEVVNKLSMKMIKYSSKEE